MNGNYCSLTCHNLDRRYLARVPPARGASHSRWHLTAGARIYLAGIDALARARRGVDEDAIRAADRLLGDALDLMRADLGLPAEPRRLPRGLDVPGRVDGPE